MDWQIEYTDSAIKELSKLDKGTARKVLAYFDKKIACMNDPSEAGKALSGKLANFWRYRIGDIRAICHIDKGTITVLVLRVAQRSTVYDDESKIASKANQAIDSFKAIKSKKNPKGEDAI